MIGQEGLLLMFKELPKPSYRFGNSNHIPTLVLTRSGFEGLDRSHSQQKFPLCYIIIPRLG